MDQNSISRRQLLRIGGLTLLAASIAPAILRSDAWALKCNPGAPTDAAGALAELIAGNARWAAGDQEHPGEDSTRRSCLATNPQTPFASILSCSDSRVGPELIFDQGLGDIFVARVAGNTASGRLIDSLLYGTAVLETPLLFVLGHTACGAIITAVNSYPKPHGLPFVNLLFPAVKQARQIVARNGGNPKDPAQVIPVATVQNVLRTVAELRKEFGLSADQAAGGVYDLATQLVTVIT